MGPEAVEVGSYFFSSNFFQKASRGKPLIVFRLDMARNTSMPSTGWPGRFKAVNFMSASGVTSVIDLQPDMVNVVNGMSLSGVRSLTNWQLSIWRAVNFIFLSGVKSLMSTQLLRFSVGAIFIFSR